MQQRKLLILDLDESLIHSSEVKLKRDPDFIVAKYYVYKRPHLDRFLNACTTWFDIAVWSAGTTDYAIAISKEIFQCVDGLAFIWGRDRCTWTFDYYNEEYYWRKILKKVKRKGYNLDAVIAVDDNPKNYKDSYGNIVGIESYYGEEEDNELELLSVYLSMIRDTDNIRVVEKRNWKSQVKKEGFNKEWQT
jgi:TFIIF-interacting CTD phosphatase-like protein